jgi:hypothetical protein
MTPNRALAQRANHGRHPGGARDAIEDAGRHLADYVGEAFPQPPDVGTRGRDPAHGRRHGDIAVQVRQRPKQHGDVHQLPGQFQGDAFGNPGDEEQHHQVHAVPAKEGRGLDGVRRRAGHFGGDDFASRGARPSMASRRRAATAGRS